MHLEIPIRKNMLKNAWFALPHIPNLHQNSYCDGDKQPKGDGTKHGTSSSLCYLQNRKKT